MEKDSDLIEVLVLFLILASSMISACGNAYIPNYRNAVYADRVDALNSVRNNIPGTVSVIDTSTNIVTATVNVGINPVAFGQFMEGLVKPSAEFSFSQTAGKLPLQVQFTDKSTGSPTSWAWSFGDGTFSTSKNPAHKYCKAGKYTVSLTVKNGLISN